MSKKDFIISGIIKLFTQIWPWTEGLLFYVPSWKVPRSIQYLDRPSVCPLFHPAYILTLAADACIIKTRGPKGNISCTWVQCANFIDRSDRTAILLFPIEKKNTNLVEVIKILLPVKFCWIPLSGFREVENISANQRPGRSSCFSDQSEKRKLGKGRWDLASCQVSLNSV